MLASGAHIFPHSPVFSHLFHLCLIPWSTSISHLRNGHQPIVAIGISQDGESTCWVSSSHPVHRIPRRRVRLIFICYCQVCHNHIHPVFWYFPIELQKTQENILPWLHKQARAMPYWIFINARKHISLHWRSDNLSNEVYLRPPRKRIVWFPCQLLPFGLNRILYLRDIIFCMYFNSACQYIFNK